MLPTDIHYSYALYKGILGKFNWLQDTFIIEELHKYVSRSFPARVITLIQYDYPPSECNCKLKHDTVA